MPGSRIAAAAAAAAPATDVETWRRERRLQELGFESYADYIASTSWFETRRRYRGSDLPQNCHLCGADERIQLHHQTYERLGCEELEDLIPLCADCHEVVHSLARRGLLESFDLEAINELVDKKRSQRNREKERARESRQRAEYRTVHARRALESRRRQAFRSLGDAVGRAEKAGLDAADLLGEIESLTADIHSRVSDRLREAA